MSGTKLTVLILGGYGTFGGRLARLLADEERLTLTVAGRSLQKAEQFCAALTARATLVPRVFDRDGDADVQLAALKPDIVVDASGPFQVYGDPYRVVRAAIAQSIDYLDLADGRTLSKASRSSTRWRASAACSSCLAPRAFRCSPPRWCAAWPSA